MNITINGFKENANIIANKITEMLSAEYEIFKTTLKKCDIISLNLEKKPEVKNAVKPN